MAMTTAAARADRIAAVAFDYEVQPKRRVNRCNLCDGSQFVVVTHRDRYGYPVRASACSRCGLVFLDPVMTQAAYGAFYDGVYRPLVSAYHGRLIDAHTIQQEQRDYARERGDFLEPHLNGRGFQTLLDVGGSTGVVAHAFAQRFNLRATVVDPAPLETAEARALGLTTIDGLIESVDIGPRQFDLVTVCQTVDHLLDIAGTLRRIRELLSDAGLLFIDIADFRAAYLRNWSIEEAVKVDHAHYLTQSTMEAYLHRVGFQVIHVDFESDHLHIGYLARPSAGRPEALPPPESVIELLREVRFVQNTPRPSSETPLRAIEAPPR